MKIQNPNLRPEELDRALDYDKALAHFFKVRGLSRDSQEAFTITVGNCVSRFAGVREAFALLDQEQDTNVPRYLSEAPVNVQARVILLNLPTVPHEGELRRAAVVPHHGKAWVGGSSRVEGVRLGSNAEVLYSSRVSGENVKLGTSGQIWLLGDVYESVLYLQQGAQLAELSLVHHSRVDGKVLLGPGGQCDRLIHSRPRPLQHPYPRRGYYQPGEPTR